MRHLTEQQALAALRRRAPIEQMLSENLEAGSFSWLAAMPSQAGCVLRLHNTVDTGSENYLDVHEFGSLDEDDDLGEGELIGDYPDEATLLSAPGHEGMSPRGHRRSRCLSRTASHP